MSLEVRIGDDTNSDEIECVLGPTVHSGLTNHANKVPQAFVYVRNDELQLPGRQPACDTSPSATALLLNTVDGIIEPIPAVREYFVSLTRCRLSGLSPVARTAKTMGTAGASGGCSQASRPVRSLSERPLC